MDDLREDERSFTMGVDRPELERAISGEFEEPRFRGEEGSGSGAA